MECELKESNQYVEYTSGNFTSFHIFNAKLLFSQPERYQQRKQFIEI